MYRKHLFELAKFTPLLFTVPFVSNFEKSIKTNGVVNHGVDKKIPLFDSQIQEPIQKQYDTLCNPRIEEQKDKITVVNRYLVDLHMLQHNIFLEKYPEIKLLLSKYKETGEHINLNKHYCECEETIKILLAFGVPHDKIYILNDSKKFTLPLVPIVYGATLGLLFCCICDIVAPH